MVVVGPEAPLLAGLVDDLAKGMSPSIGLLVPTQAAS
jgi:phosphoribosylamine-glycine ligase